MLAHWHCGGVTAFAGSSMPVMCSEPRLQWRCTLQGWAHRKHLKFIAHLIFFKLIFVCTVCNLLLLWDFSWSSHSVLWQHPSPPQFEKLSSRGRGWAQIRPESNSPGWIPVHSLKGQRQMSRKGILLVLLFVCLGKKWWEFLFWTQWIWSHYGDVKDSVEHKPFKLMSR